MAGIRMLQSNSMDVSNLIIETIAVCGAAPQMIISNQNPATNIPVCASEMGNYPKLLKVDVVLAGEGQEQRKYTLDLSKPDHIPSELNLNRLRDGNRIVYQITDKGGAVKSSVDLVTQFTGSGLSVVYIDQHFFDGFKYEVISDAVMRASYIGCASCVTDLGLSTLPTGFKVVANDPGKIDIDSSAAPGGSYDLLLAVKKEAGSSEVSMAHMTINITRVTAEPTAAQAVPTSPPANSIPTSAPPAPSAANLFQNPGFEDGMAPWIPLLNAAFTLEAPPQVVPGFSGKAIYKQTNMPVRDSFVQNVSLVAGKRYRIRVPFLAVNKPRTNCAALSVYHQVGQAMIGAWPFNMLGDSASFTRVGVTEFTASKTGVSPIIVEVSDCGGAVQNSPIDWWLDNLVLEEVLPEIHFGDVDGNGQLQSADTTLINRYLAGAVMLSDEQKQAADVTRNGAVTQLDADYVRKAIGQMVTLPVANHPPVLEAVAKKTVAANAILRWKFTAMDPDENPIVYAATIPNEMSGAIFDTATGVLTWNAPKPGKYTVGFTASDYEMVTIGSGPLEVLPAVVFGDVNGDGVVTTVDSSYLQKFLKNLATLTDTQKVAADVNLDGVLDMNDNQAILDFLSGNVTKLPLGN